MGSTLCPPARTPTIVSLVAMGAAVLSHSRGIRPEFVLLRQEPFGADMIGRQRDQGSWKDSSLTHPDGPRVFLNREPHVYVTSSRGTVAKRGEDVTMV